MITSLSPDTCTAGDPDFTLTVFGSEMLCDGLPLARVGDEETFDVLANETSWTFVVPAQFVGTVGDKAVTIECDDGQASNALQLHVVAP